VETELISLKTDSQKQSATFYRKWKLLVY